MHLSAMTGCATPGFFLSFAGSKPAIMGDERPFQKGQILLADFPVACHIRLIKDGHLIGDSREARLEHRVEEAGVYRVEGWLTLDGEERPWIYSNPIYLR